MVTALELGEIRAKVVAKILEVNIGVGAITFRSSVGDSVRARG